MKNQKSINDISFDTFDDSKAELNPDGGDRNTEYNTNAGRGSESRFDIDQNEGP